MKSLARQMAMIVGGVCWLSFAVVFAMFAVPGVLQNGGFSVLGLVLSSEASLIGTAHLLGMVAASFICFAVGVGLCACGLVPRPKIANTRIRQAKQSVSLLRRVFAAACVRSENRPMWPCVRCNTELGAPAQICQACGWTQPYTAELR